MRIAVDGNIASGKSTVVRDIDVGNGGNDVAHEEPVHEWIFLDKFYADKRAYAFPFSLEVLASFASFTDTTGTTITERSPLTNREVFTKMHANDGTISEDEFALYKRVYDAIGWTPDAIVFIRTPARVCHDRMIRRGRPCEMDVGIEYLERIEKSYDTLLRFAHVPVAIIDGTQSPPDVLRDVRAALHAFERTHHAASHAREDTIFLSLPCL